MRHRLVAVVVAAVSVALVAGVGPAPAGGVRAAPPASLAAPSTGPTTTPPPPAPPAIDIADVVDVGEAKVARPYDAYLAASLHDIEAWWDVEYQRLYGRPFTPLSGGIYAAYPQRTSAIPPCRADAAATTYQEVAAYAAFYCPFGDFMAYDDGDQGVLFGLASSYGPAILAVVLAHEFGHAIQFRNGQFGGEVETIRTEQQADCFSGAWARRAWDGDASALDFADSDVRTGLIALVLVRDPVGLSPFEHFGHGSAFDRIGAFQQGFIGGIDSCVGLIDHPLPLLPNTFNPANPQDALTQGNAPFGWGDQQIMGIVQNDLISFWPAELAAAGPTIPLIQLRPVTGALTGPCAGAVGGLVESGAAYCADPAGGTHEVLFDEARARALYDQFGDFAVGYVIGHAWADGIQAVLGYTLDSERRSMISDCLTGAWISDAIHPPDDFVGTTTLAPLHPGRTMVVSPGDLDEAVQTALLIGDPGFDDNVKGSAFEKIAYLRLGVLEGTGRCLEEGRLLMAGSAA